MSVIDARKAWLPVGVVAVALLAVAGGAYRLALEVAAFSTKIERLERAVESFKKDSWTRGDQERFTLQLQLANPNLRIPGVFHAEVKEGKQ